MTEARLRLSLGIAALLMELGALLVLLVPEARTSEGASVWSWYWPLANSLYFLGLIAAGVAIISALPGLVATREQREPGERMNSLATLGVSVLAIVINRLVNYR